MVSNDKFYHRVHHLSSYSPLRDSSWKERLRLAASRAWLLLLLLRSCLNYLPYNAYCACSSYNFFSLRLESNPPPLERKSRTLATEGSLPFGMNHEEDCATGGRYDYESTTCSRNMLSTLKTTDIVQKNRINYYPPLIRTYFNTVSYIIKTFNY